MGGGGGLASLLSGVSTPPPLLLPAALALLAGVIALLVRRAVERYAARPLLNASEKRLFSVLLSAVKTLPGPPVRVMCQVSYGEFLSSRSTRAFFRINAKRADFLLVDHEFQPLLVVEYQGAGHYGQSRAARASARARDKVKRRALLSAGIPLMEIPARYDARSIRETLHETLRPAATIEARHVG